MRFGPRRELGRTGFVATALGAGDLADRSVPLEECAARLRRALDAGLNVVDTAPQYEDGYSEQVVGAALRGRRGGVFVIDKIDHFDQPVRKQIDESLQRLGMAQVDAMVFHNVSTLQAWEELTAHGGPWTELERAVADGQVRFRGISSHHPDVLLAALEAGACDVVMFPVGPFVDRRYEEEILPMARTRGVGTVGFKTFGAGKLVGDTEGYGRALSGRSGLPRLSVEECVHYTLTLDPDVALLGLSNAEEQDAAFAAARKFRALGAEELERIRVRAAEAVRGKGEVWWNPEER